MWHGMCELTNGMAGDMTIVVVHDCLAVAVPKDLASFMSRGRYVGFKDVSPYIFQHITFPQKQYQVGEIG